MSQSPIKVLHPITRLIIGGAQENTMLTCALLDPARWQADIICGPQTGPEGSIIDEVRVRGIPLTIEPTLVREINPIKDFCAFVQLYRLLRREKYMVIHTHSSKAGILGRWAAWFAGTPIILHTVHGWGHTDYQHPLVRQFYITLEKLSLRITKKLIVVSPRDIEKGIRDGIGSADDYVVIRSGIELDRFGHPQVPPHETRQTLGIPKQALVVGTVTRLSPQKSPLDFVQMAVKVAKQRDDVYFVMVGDGTLRSEVERVIAEENLTERIILTGLRRDVPELMATFDLFVLTSLWEGLPRVLPQAMATALPIVATAVDGNAEAVTDGENGYLVPPGETSAIAEAVLNLLSNPQLRQQMGQAGQARAIEFGARKMVTDIARLYEQLV